MMSDVKVRRGGIYLVDVDPVVGSGPGKKRPALVVQNDLGNVSAGTTIVVGLSSRVPAKLYPFHVLLPAEILGKAGIIMCEQIRTVALERIGPQVLAECSPEVMKQVEEAVRHSLGLSSETAVVDREKGEPS